MAFSTKLSSDSNVNGLLSTGRAAVSKNLLVSGVTAPPVMKETRGTSCG